MRFEKKKQESPGFSNPTPLKRFRAFARNLYHWRIDRYLRYAPVINIIKKEGGSNILEIGPGCRGITAFWPHEVKGIDPEFDKEPLTGYLEREKGTVLDLDVKDREHEIVVCVDVLEHLRPENRGKAIHELVRVADKLLIIAVPCGERAEHYDRKLYSAYKKRVKSYHRRLDEHLRYGLPSCSWVLERIKDFCSSQNRAVQKLKVLDNSDVRFWLWLNKFLMAKNYHWFLLKNKLFLPFKDLLWRFNSDPYRKIFSVSFE